MRLRFRTMKTLLATLSLVACVSLGQRAKADYISTLNTIAGADRISHWRLGEASGSTAEDEWGAGTPDGENLGTYSDVTLGAAGPSSASGHIGFGDTNSAIEFTGLTTQLLEMADAASFDTMGSLTMTLWFNIPSSIATTDTVQRYYGGLSDSTDGASGRYGFAVNAGVTTPGSSSNQGRIRGFVRLDDSGNPGTEFAADSGLTGVGPENFRDGNWHMLVMTMGDNGGDKEFEIFVDGVSEFSGTLAGAAAEDLATRHTGAATGILAFGADPGDTNRRFLGLMDEISFIGRRLSGSEVGALYDSAFAPVSSTIPEPSALAVWGLALVGGLAVRRRFQA